MHQCDGLSLPDKCTNEDDCSLSLASCGLSITTTTSNHKENDSLLAVSFPLTDDDTQSIAVCCSASSSDDEELLCLQLDRAMMSSSDEESVSCCWCSGCDDDSHHPDVGDTQGADSNILVISNVCDNDIESEEEGGWEEDEEDDEGFVSFKFDDYPESVYEGVEGGAELAHPCQLYVDGYCLCVRRFRANLNESVKSR